MAHSNSTTNYNLPQFISTDKPAWLTDVNTAYSDIDTGMHNAQITADSAQSDATQALTTAGEAATSAAAADAKGSGAIASIATAFDTTATYDIGDNVIYNNLLYRCSVAVINPGPWSGSANWERTSVDSIASGLKDDINSIKATEIEMSTTDNTSVADAIADCYNAFAVVDIPAFNQNGAEWTAPHDGFLQIRTSGTFTGVGYVYVTEMSTNRVLGTIANPNGNGGLTYTINMPVMKGVRYLLSMSGYTAVGSKFTYLTHTTA